MLDAMNADFLLSTDKDPELDDFDYLDRSARVGLTGFLICAAAKSITRCISERSVDGFEKYFREDLVYLAGKHPDMCKEYNVTKRVDGSIEPDDSPYILASVLPIAASWFSLDEMLSCAEKCVTVLNGNSDSMEAAELLCRMIHSVQDYDEDPQGFIDHVKAEIMPFDRSASSDETAELNGGKSYVACALRAAIEGGDPKEAVRYILKTFGRNRLLAAIAAKLASRLRAYKIILGNGSLSHQGYYKGSVPEELQKIHINYRHVNRLFGDILSQPEDEKVRLESYDDVFVELEDRLNCTDHLLRIYHDHCIGGCSFDISVLRNIVDDENYDVDKEFISIHEDDFYWMSGLFTQYIEDWDIYDDSNRLSVKDLRRSWDEAQRLIEDIEAEVMTDLLWSLYKDVSLYTLDEDAWREEMCIDDKLDDQTKENEARAILGRAILGRAIFKHKDKLTRFIRAFYWFFFEHLKLKDDDDSVINISGY